MAYTLRVSVLDACQLRCRYCLPASLGLIKKTSWLTLAQYEGIAQALKPFGIHKVRFTGGEPLLRSELSAIVQIFSTALSGVECAITTNGLRFIPLKHALLEAGITAITFHIDTLRPERYGLLMGDGELSVVLKSLEHAQKLGINVKLNVVMQKGVNDDEIRDFLLFSKQYGVVVRFIELMNTGSAQEYVRDTFMSGEDILHEVSQHWTISPVGRPDAHAPAELFLAHELGLQFGLIASDTRPFCQACNRLRLSADGHLRTCLYEPQGYKLDCSQGLSLYEQIAAVVSQKTSFHPLNRKERQNFSMAQIGG